MDSFYIDLNGRDSRQCRSGPNDQNHQNPSSSSHLATLNNRDASSTPLHSVPPTKSSFNSFKIQDRQGGASSPSSFIAAPVPRQTAPAPILGQNEFDWTFNQTREIQGSAPLLRLDPAESSFSREPSDRNSPFHSNIPPANMSAVGVQHYDSQFDAGIQGIRQSYTWPNFEVNINQQYFQIPSAMTFEEPKLMPVYARSLSSSPPRGNLTPEQRELKRQRDTARRDSKTKIRRDRSTSNPYIVSQHGSPNLVPGQVSEYTSSISPSPLLSQASPAMSNSSFLAPFPTQTGVDGGQPDIYAPVYTMGPNDFTTPAYSMPYSDPVAILPSQTYIQRTQSLSSSSDHQMYHPHSSPHHPMHQVSTTAKLESGDHIRLLPGRPKPQCWEHGCNGRQFSTFSNLLRHQREKSGAATKSSCPHCGAEFTRTTARNGHMAHEKCKQQQRRNS